MLVSGSVCKLHTVSLQIPLKENFPKLLGELLFGTYHARLDFLIELQNTGVSVTLLKSDCIADAHSNFKNSRSIQRKHLRWSPFSL